jgi:hypothetical protein
VTLKLFFFCLYLSFSQPTDKFSIGIETVTTFTTKSSFYGAEILMGHKTYTFSVALLKTHEFSHEVEGFGGQISFCYYPNSRINVFNFYFSYQFQYLPFLYESTLVNVDINYFQHFIGYGFRMDITNHFSLNKNFGIGLSNETRAYNYSNQEFNSTKSHQIHMALLLKLGISYVF